MKILQVNATFGQGSTGSIVRDIHNYCIAQGHDSYVAYAIADKNVANGYKIGNWLTNKRYMRLFLEFQENKVIFRYSQLSVL